VPLRPAPSRRCRPDGEPGDPAVATEADDPLRVPGLEMQRDADHDAVAGHREPGAWIPGRRTDRDGSAASGVLHVAWIASSPGRRASRPAS
jgi:hypothetical protein